MRLWAILFVAMSAGLIIVETARGRAEPVRLMVEIGLVLAMSGVIAYIARTSWKRH